MIRIRATPEEVRQCILSANRILEYYPMGNESGDIEAGRSFYCKGRRDQQFGRRGSPF